MMKAVCLNKKKLSEKTVPIPKPGAGEVQVKLLYSGVCRSDLHVVKGEVYGLQTKPDLICGHEGVGIVSELGQGVKEPQIGTMVVVPWFGGGCGQCGICKLETTGSSPYCPKVASTGFTRDGTYAEYVVVNTCGAVLVPEGLSPQQAAPLACAGLTAYKALKESGVKANGSVVIMGAAGGLGHLALQYAKAMNIKVVGVDLGVDKIKFVKELGFPCIDGSSKEWQKELEAIVGDNGPDAVLVVGPSEKAYQDALQCVRRKGAVVALSLPPAPIKFPIRDVVIKGVRLIGSLVGSHQDLKEALDFALEHDIKCQIHEANLCDVAKVQKDLEGNKFPGRAVLTCCSPAEAKKAAEMKCCAPAVAKNPPFDPLSHLEAMGKQIKDAVQKSG